MNGNELSHFFALEEYSHNSLFKGCQYPWQALSSLHEYLKNLKLGKIEVDLPPSAHLVNPAMISIGAGTVVEPGA